MYLYIMSHDEQNDVRNAIFVYNTLDGREERAVQALEGC